MQLSRKLTLAFASTLLVMLVVALYGFFSLSRSLNTFETEVDAYSHYEIAVGDLSSEFKTQVQEWKNVLLRGKDPKALDKYWDAFNRQEKVVAEKVRKLGNNLPEGEGKALIGKFAQAHSKMGEGYRKGFEAFKAANFEASVGDAAVQGVDREPSKLLEEAIKKFGIESDAVSARVAADGRRAMLVAVVLMLLMCGVGLGVSVWLGRGVNKQLGGDPDLANRVAFAVAQGDLTTVIPVIAGDSESLMAHLKGMQDSLTAVVIKVRQGSEGVATASAEIAAGNHALSSRTERQARALEQTAASMDQLSSTVHQNADNARQSNQLAMSASAVAVQGGEVVGQVVQTMKGINDSSRKISDIISVIDGIAFQTNILALTAAVEAARAGEQGRGFAVVASEVRSLAGRSAEAAKEIKSLISASVERVEQGTVLVDQAGATMHEVVSSIRRVTDIMGEISAASQEQSLGVAQVGEAVTSLDQTTQQNAALVEEMAAAASSLNSQAGELVQAVSVFKLTGGHGGGLVSRAATRSATPRPYAAAAERRGPNRAAHAPARPKSTGAPAPAAKLKAQPAAAPAAEGDDWEAF